LAKLNQFIAEREAWAKYYNEQLADLGWLSLPQFSDDFTHGWQSYVTMVDESNSPMSRNEIMQKLQVMGISTRPGTHAVHMLGFYSKKYGLQSTDFPGAQASNDFSMSIPLHNRMVPEDFEYIVQILKSL
jgi:dTDP-4-amino-4,6-dideoxygalactose transaminase